MVIRGIVARRALLATGLALTLSSVCLGSVALEEAVARGETRTLSIYNIHTKESLTVTFKRDGQYDREALKQINHIMRDWRKDQSREMDPALIDLIWTLHETLGSKEPIKLISGYRSAATNSAMRRRGGGQAKNSQHTHGKAADIHFPDVPVKTLRNSALVQEWGGVGYYPTSGIPFVHVDTGRVRMWPRIARLELAALFPDGNTKYLPTDGRPITPKDYQLAVAKGLTRGNTMVASAAPKPEIQPAVQVGAAPQPILASYTPEAMPAVASGPAPSAPLPSPKRFAYANVGGGGLTMPEMFSRDEGFPLYQQAEVVGAPEADDDHPDELSYVPFEVASLMTDVSITYNHAVAELTHPEQDDLDYLFEDMDRPLAATFRPTSNYQGLAAAQRFTGHAVRSLHAELAPPKPTQLAQAAR
jgi:uncharacterized protein YcbK (DUF882 family)